MIHVCFPLYDSNGKYSKYEAVTLLSLLTNTKSDLTVHIIHDDSVSEDAKNKIRRICNDYNQEIIFYELVARDFENIGHMARSYTIGTLFRLKLPDLLDVSIKKIIYLDADLLINTDIRQIWDIDISESYIAACHDDGLNGLNKSRIRLSDGLVTDDKYFNAGVMVINLKKIRQDFDLFSVCVDFLIEHPNCTMADQDALNYLFADNVLFLPYKYNMFTRKKRGHNLSLEDGIYHFSADYCNPEQKESFDDLFFHYLFILGDEQWLTEYYMGALQNSNKQLMLYQSFMKCITSKCVKKIYWGADSKYFDKVADFIKPNTNYDYIVDSNKKIHGKYAYGMVISAPTQIYKENVGDFVVIVISRSHYSTIKHELEDGGLIENENFFDGVAFLSLSQGGYGHYY